MRKMSLLDSTVLSQLPFSRELAVKNPHVTTKPWGLDPRTWYDSADYKNIADCGRTACKNTFAVENGYAIISDYGVADASGTWHIRYGTVIFCSTHCLLAHRVRTSDTALH